MAGKTGTTEDYGDAWFVGWTPRYTVAVWVGYPDEVMPMKPPTFSFNGEPVAGGTYPAAIWQTFMKSAYTIHPPPKDEDGEIPVPGASTTPAPAPAAPVTSAPETSAPEAEATGRRRSPRPRRSRSRSPRRRSRRSRRRRAGARSHRRPAGRSLRLTPSP